MFALLVASSRKARNSIWAFHRIAAHLARSYGDSASSNVIRSPHGDCEIPNTSVAQRFYQTASRWPHKVAIECGITGRSYTYDQLRTLSRQFGSALVRMGFRRGDVLAMLLPNIPEYPIALLGASGIGMSVSLLNPLYTADEIHHQCVSSGVSAIVGVPPMAMKMLHVFQRNAAIRRMILIGGSQDGFATFEDMLKDPGDLFDEDIDCNTTEDTFVLLNSSGTTGPPKSVMLTHSNLLANVQQALYPGSCALRTAQGDDRDSYVGVIPFFHSFGLNAQLLAALESGGRVVTLPRFEAATYLKAIDKIKPTVLFVAPPLASFLTHFPGLKAESLSRLNLIFSGGASMGVTLATRLLERLGNHFSLQEGFGITEASPGTHFSPMHNAKIGSVGAPISRTKAKVVDVDTGEALGPNQNGELCVMGPQVMKGYLNNSEATKQAVDPSGWLHTGDVAYYDQDGHFFVVDRLKELIKVKGFQVSPTELEELLMRHPAVADAAVIGVPDEYAGELPRAYVVKRPAVSLNAEDLETFLRPKVAPHKQLKGGVCFVDSIPKSSTGKIIRKELKSRACQS